MFVRGWWITDSYSPERMMTTQATGRLAHARDRMSTKAHRRKTECFRSHVSHPLPLPRK